MPVENHAVHERTKHDANAPRWCVNRPDFKKSYTATMKEVDASGNYTGQMILVEVRSDFMPGCKYDMSLTDPACATCWRRGCGENYDREVRNSA